MPDNQKILTFFRENPDIAFKKIDLFAEFEVGISPKEMSDFTLQLDQLVAEGQLKKTPNARYKWAGAALVGVFEHVNTAFGFVRIDGQENDVFVPERDMNTAIDGDRVLVEVSTQKKKGENPVGRIIKIEKRGRTEIVGTLRSNGKYALVRPDAKRLYGEIFVPKEAMNGAETGHKVILKITQYATEFVEMKGKVIEILGMSGTNETEMNAIMAEYGLPVKFPDAVEKEAEAIPVKIPEAEIKKRRDFRKVLTFTIDPADAKDFDDALSYVKNPDGTLEIGVHIADVSHYVQPGTQLEEEALKRATSVYLVDRCVPMLPEVLSNNLCSLRPHEEKLTFSAVFTLDANAHIMTEWYGRTVIYSDRRFSYEEAQEIIESGEGDYAEVLTTLNQLAKKLKKDRFANGAINFETPEIKFKLDENGTPLGVYQKIRKDAHKLIEEFMLLANRKVAEKVHKSAPELPLPFRVHAAPDPEKLRQFAGFALKFGHKINVDTTGMGLSRALNGLMATIEGKPEQGVLENLAVRSMAKAIYTTEAKGHFGLAFDFYTHFTSPIRRYPDVLTHRVLQAFIDQNHGLNKTEFEQRCKHSSDREKLAAEAERASIKYKQVEFMSLQNQQKVYAGIVTGLTDFGMFVELENTGCEGMVRLSTLTEDYYEYDEKNLCILGRRTGHKIAFGDAVMVKVLATDLEKRTIDLALVMPPGKYGKKIVKQPSRGRRHKR